MVSLQDGQPADWMTKKEVEVFFRRRPATILLLLLCGLLGWSGSTSQHLEKNTTKLKLTSRKNGNPIRGGAQSAEATVGKVSFSFSSR